MYKKLSLLVTLICMTSIGLNARESTRCVDECLKNSVAIDTKRVAVWNKDAGMIHEHLTILNEALKNADTYQALQINLRLALMLPEYVDAIPYFDECIKLLPGSNHIRTFIKSIKPGDLILMSETDVPETYALVKKHMRSMNMKVTPTIMLSRAKDLDGSPAANLLSSAGIVMIPEATLKQKLTDNQLNGLLVHQLAQIKQSQKSIGFVATLVKSNFTLLLANLTILASQQTKLYNKYADLSKNPPFKNWVLNKALSYAIYSLPYVGLNVVWARARRMLQKNADDGAAYNTKAAQYMIDYLRFLQKEEGFNIELWDQANERLDNGQLNIATKTFYKSLTALLKWKLIINSYLFGGDQDTSQRIENMENKLKRYQRIDDQPEELVA